MPSSNRLATASDATTYSDQGVVENDIIAGTKTNTSPYNYYYEGQHLNTWSGARANPTLWIDSSIDADTFKFSNEAGSVNWAETLTIKPLHTDGNPVEFRNNAAASNASTFEVDHIDNLIVDGETEQYPGFKYVQSALGGFGINAKDRFGFVFNCKNDIENAAKMIAGTNQYANTPSNQKWRGCYYADGFATLRAFPSNVDMQNTVLFERCFFDKGYSEGDYIGMTGNSPKPQTGITLRDCWITLRGAESIQQQEILNNSKVQNCVIYIGAIRGHNSFQPNQDNGAQLLILEDHIFENNIIYGWGENGLILFDTDETIAGLNPTKAIFRKNFMGQGRGRGVLFNGIAGGVSHEFYNNYFGNLLDTHADLPFQNTGLDVVFAKSGTNTDERVAVGNNYKTGNTFESNSALTKKALNATGAHPDPDFILTGFEGLNITKVLEWSTAFGRSVNAPQGTVTGVNDAGGGDIEIVANNSFSANDVVILYSIGQGYEGTYVVKSATATDFIVTKAYNGNATGAYAETAYRSYTTDDVGVDPVDGNYYRNISPYTTTLSSPRPALDATHWELMQWDQAGVRYDQVGFDAGTAQNRPPLNLGLKANSYYNKRGLGFGNEDNTDYHIIKGYVADDNVGTNAKRIPIPSDRKVDAARYTQLESGKYFRFGVKEPNENEVYTNWTLIA